MKAEDVKIGMKVKIVSNPPQNCYGHGEVGNVLTIVVLPDGLHCCGADGFKEQYSGEIGYINCAYIEPDLFTKADLKTGMRVVYRDGSVRVIADGVTRNAGFALGFSLSSFREDLLYNNSYNAKYDIMEVYAAPASCEDFFNLDVRGELLFKREEAPVKTEKQLQAEKLMERADKLKEEFEALVKQATDLAGE